MSINLVDLPIKNIPEAHQKEAENKAKEAYIMTLLKYHHLSTGKAAKILGINHWKLSDLMSIYQISPFAEQTQEELEKEVSETLEMLGFCE